MNNRILIVDDDEEMSRELQEILVDKGYAVDVALNGRRGIELIKEEKYAVVILDLKLPEINGYEVLKIVKQNPQSPKVIVFSGRPLGNGLIFNKAEVQQEEDVLKLADIVLSKSVQVPVLIDRIKEYIY